MSEICICLFAKAPEPGRSKTRLASVLGSQGAAELARALLLDAVALWRASPDTLLIASTGRMDVQMTDALEALPTIQQEGADLGARMEHALQVALERAEIALVVGSDVPDLDQEVMEAAREAMRTHDAVMLPTEDGGFGLLAVRACPTDLLQDLPWSSEETLARSLERLEQKGLRVALLPPSFDVDRPSDLPALVRSVRNHPTRLHHTRAFLDSAANQSISVVVPVINEARRLPGLLDALTVDEALTEIIVVDGGSTDASKQIVEQHPAALLVTSPPGRAAQMNAGAKIATGATLLFLHADAQLPAGAGASIQRSLCDGERVAGAFRLKTRYDPSARHRPWIKAFLPLADLRSYYTGCPYGDQALFVRAREFWREGGYPELPLFEDLALAQALRKRRPLDILPGAVEVSARRFQERPLYYLALMNSLPILYRLGVAPGRLERWYRSRRAPDDT